MSTIRRIGCGRVATGGTTFTQANFEGNAYSDESTGFPKALEKMVEHVANAYRGTSTTSNAVGTGSKTWTVTNSNSQIPAFAVGMPVRVARTAAPTTTYMQGEITAFTASASPLGVADGGTGAATAGAALGDHVGVAGNDPHLVDCHAHGGRRDLRHDRLGALALFRDTRGADDIAFRIKPQCATVLRGYAPSNMDEVRGRGADGALIDVNLPAGNGIDLVVQMQAEGINIPIIVMTGYIDAAEKVRAMGRANVQVLLKPFDLHKMREMLSQAMDAAA